MLALFVDCSSKARMTVLDEVTHAFSPWVQRLLLDITVVVQRSSLSVVEAAEHL